MHSSLDFLYDGTRLMGKKKKKKLTVKLTSEEERNLFLISSITQQIFENLQGKYVVRTPGGFEVKMDFDRIYSKEEVLPFAVELIGCVFLTDLMREVDETLTLTLKGVIEEIIVPFLRESDSRFKNLSDEEVIEEFKEESFKSVLETGILKPAGDGYRITGKIFRFSDVDEMSLVRAFRRLPSD